ncbi:MAG: serine/threonine-protein kinase [Candidatus Limnocylindria bacterium]
MPAERARMDEQLILDRYRLIERLAVGGSAEVWHAHDVQLDRHVAVKRLHPHLLPDQASRRRLAAEARAAASLSHPVIVDVYDVDATGEAPALIMELVDGESLSARIDRDGPMPDREAAAATADIADALYHAHQRGVIHRDVKPGNVLLAKDGRTRLVDFGIAHSLAESAERLTLDGTVIGTLSAMAPEQLAGGPITPRTDLYGLGVVLHEALTGRPPYPAGSPGALIDAQRAGPPPLDGLDPVLAGIVAACLAVEPENRPLHAGALAVALRSWMAGDSVAALAMVPTGTHLAAATDTAAVTQAMPVSLAPRAAARPAAEAVAGPPARRRPLALIGALVALLLLAGAAVMASALGPGDGAIGGESSPTISASIASASTPAPALPDWLAGLVAKIAKECGDEVAAEAQAEMVLTTEDQAEAYADEQVSACKDDEDDRGGGNGQGRGNDNGRGNDD